MDAINPTLAFAALFLGLSGHPRDVPEPVQHQAAIVLPGNFGCGDLVAASAVPPAEPAGNLAALADEDEPDFDLGWMEPVSPAPDEAGIIDEAGCDTSVSQP